MAQMDWRGRHYSFFQNKECEYFPCHKGIDVESFNCLFCYCPLYALGKACGGNPRYTKDGIKDCTNCDFPHQREHYGSVIQQFPRINELMHQLK